MCGFTDKKFAKSRASVLNVGCYGGIENALAQAGQGAVLTLAKQAGLGVGQHQGKTRGEVWSWVVF
jgi:hypothetical protein